MYFIMYSRNILHMTVHLFYSKSLVFFLSVTGQVSINDIYITAVGFYCFYTFTFL